MTNESKRDYLIYTNYPINQYTKALEPLKNYNQL